MDSCRIHFIRAFDEISIAHRSPKDRRRSCAEAYFTFSPSSRTFTLALSPISELSPTASSTLAHPFCGECHRT